MDSDLDRDMEGGRLINVGRPRGPFDAVRFIDLCEVERQVAASRSPVMGGGGGRGSQGVQGPSGVPGPQGNVGPQGLPGVTQQNFQFGENIPVPGAGTLQLDGPGNTLVGFRVYRAGTITAASIQVDVADATNDYNLDIRVNGISVATVPLPSGSTGASSVALAAAVVVGDVVTAFMVRTAGADESDFTEEHAVIEISA